MMEAGKLVFRRVGTGWLATPRLVTESLVVEALLPGWGPAGAGRRLHCTDALSGGGKKLVRLLSQLLQVQAGLVGEVGTDVDWQLPQEELPEEETGGGVVVAGRQQLNHLLVQL